MSEVRYEKDLMTPKDQQAGVPLRHGKLISDMPPELRPYEKCEALGAEYLSDPELLAVIIKTGTASISAVGLAEEILYPSGQKTGFRRLMQASLEELREIKGIGRVKSIQLCCLGELCRRMSRERAEEHPDMGSPGSVADYYMPRLKDLSEEEVHIMLLDSRCRMIRSFLVSKGTVNYSAVSPREIFIPAVSCRAAAMIMVHNHPSGDPEPSSEDIRFSRLLEDLGRMMNIPLQDSIVIGDNLFISLAEKGLIHT